MFSQVPTVFTRAAFDVVDAATVKQLKLRVRYDDGFIAWLNGQQNQVRPMFPPNTTQEQLIRASRAFDLAAQLPSVHVHSTDGQLVLEIVVEKF